MNIFVLEGVNDCDVICKSFPRLEIRDRNIGRLASIVTEEMTRFLDWCQHSFGALGENEVADGIVACDSLTVVSTSQSMMCVDV